MNRKVFVSCAVTGSGDAAKRHPDLLKTPDQIAKAAIEAAKTGILQGYYIDRDKIIARLNYLNNVEF